jgi:rhodanese-related sulfurtransferase
MNNKIIIIIFVLIIIFGGFLLSRKSPQKTVSFTTLTSTQLATILEQKDFFFANVHIPYEGEIKNTDAFIPYDKIADNLDKLPKDKNTKIVLYCRSGRMSEIAAREFIQLGYTQVSHLSGGMIDWEKQGFNIIIK